MDEKSDVLAGNTRDSELNELRADMNRTKNDMEETIQQVRERFSLEHVKHKTQEAAEELGEKASDLIQAGSDDMKRAADWMSQTVKENPIPFAVIGAMGAGMLAYSLFQRRRGQNQWDENRWDEQYHAGEEVSESYGSETYPEGDIHQYFEEEEYAEEGIEGLKEKAGSLVQDIGDRAKRLRQQAQVRSERLGSDIVETIKENPFITGMTIFFIGLLSGLVFPPTRKEQELLGPASYAVREKVLETKEEVVEGIERVAEQTKQAAKEELDKLGRRTDG